MVRNGQIHYFVAAGRMMRGETGSDAAHRIAEWVAENYTATSVGGATLYELDAA
jgi:hypothetical protein